MAHVTTTHAERASFSRRLELVTRNWEGLIPLAAEWHEWDLNSRMDFLTDWPVTESYTELLLAMETTLPPDDARTAKLRALRALIDQNRPILEELEARIHE